MTNTLSEDFENFIKIISLNETLKEDIMAKYNSFCKMLNDEELQNKYKISNIKLSGSYAKGTELKEFDENENPDLDLVLILDTTEEDANAVIAYFYDFIKEKKEGLTEDIKIQGNSIGLKYHQINMDIVLAKKADDEALLIASNRQGKWIESNCLKQVDYMNNMHHGYYINYKNLMKLFKYLNKEILSKKLKSYTLEMLVHQCTPTNEVDLTLWTAFSKTLGNITNVKDIHDIKDCCDITKSGFDEKDVEIFDDFKKDIYHLYDMSLDALNGNRKKWEEIFGDRFPKQPDKRVINNNKYDKNQMPWGANEN